MINIYSYILFENKSKLDDLIEKRNIILAHLDEVLKGGKNLKEKNIEKYFSALNGKYIRNNICISGSSKKCEYSKNISIGGAHNLLKILSNKKFNMIDVLSKFKGSAPKLYEVINNKASTKVSTTSSESTPEIKYKKELKKNLEMKYQKKIKENINNYFNNYQMNGGTSKLREEIEKINIDDNYYKLFKNNLREQILGINI
jgi:hypothetical protein